MKKLSIILALLCSGCFADSKFGKIDDVILMPFVGSKVPDPAIFKKLNSGSSYTTEICRANFPHSRRKLINQTIEKTLKNTGALVLKDAKITAKAVSMFRSCVFITAIPMYDGNAPKDESKDETIPPAQHE